MARFGTLAQYFDNSGNVLAAGTIGFYTSGSTEDPSNLIVVYSDINQTTPITNPVTLDGYGRQPNVFFTGSAKAVLRSAAGVLIDSEDPVGQTSVDSQFNDWLVSFSYPLDAVVLYSGKYYESILAPNLGHQPDVSPTYWKLFINAILPDQTVVTAGYTAIGDTTTGLVGVNGKPKGTILVGNATVPAALAVGTNDYVLTADSTQTLGVKWAASPAAPNNIQEFSGSGTWTKPGSVTSVLVEMWAGGGGGGGDPASFSGGGGGGGYTIVLLAASACGATESVTIGAGGTGGTAGTGGTGGNTTFGSLATARGGRGGTGGGTGAGGASGDYVLAGGGVSTGISAWASSSGGSNNGVNGTVGGDCIMGGGGGGSSGTSSSGAGGTSLNGGNGGAGRTTAGTATAGSTKGGGGGGASAGTGGAGGAGYARITSW